MLFGVDTSSSVHVDNKEKDILILGIDPTQWLDDTTLTAETQYSLHFAKLNRKFSLSLHCNESNSFLFVNGTKIYCLKAKNSKIKKHPLCLGNISGAFLSNNIKKILNGCASKFSVDYKAFDISDMWYYQYS